MATFREMALAAHTAAQQTARTALVEEARVAVTPVLTDQSGKVVIDPKTLTVAAVHADSGTVVLATPEPTAADRTFLAVRDAVVHLTWQDAGAWRKDGPVVGSLVEAGDALAALTGKASA